MGNETNSSDMPIERASTIASDWYYEEAVYQGELEQIFRRSWQCVGRLDQVAQAGDFFTCEVAGEPLLIVRGKEGVRAFYNVCRHRAGSPARDQGNCKNFRCHYHGWTYGLDGRLLNAPEMEGVEGFSLENFGLVPCLVASWGKLLFVNLDQGAQSINAWLGDIPERTKRFDLDALVFTDRVEYVIECNWKLYVDNFLEGYHIPWAHPGLNQILDYASYTVEDYTNYVLQYALERDVSDVANPQMQLKKQAWQGAKLVDYDKAGSEYYWIFPNFMWNLSPDVAQSNMVVPLGAEKTKVVFDFYYDAESAKSEEIRRSNIEFSHEVQLEDIDICERVQRNLHSSAYARGRYCAKRENGVYRFHIMLKQWLSDL